MTALTLSAGAGLRRLPVPVAEPRPALRVVPDHHRIADPGTPDLMVAPVVPLRAPREPASPSRPSHVGAEAPRRVPPPAAAWARQFIQAALEAAAGRRPISQLVRWTGEDVFAMLNRRATLAARLDRGSLPAAGSCLVRSLRLCRPAASVVEASAVVVDRGRYRAVALRLEDADGRWRVTALEIG